MAADVKVKTGIDGAKKFQDDLKNMTAKSKALDAEMKALTSQFDKEGKSQKNNAEQMKLMNQQMETQKKKAEILSAEIKRLEDAGEGETAACYKLRQQLAETTTRMNEYANGAGDAGEKTESATSQFIKAGVALGAMHVAASALLGALKGIGKAAIGAAKGVWNLGVDAGQWADSLITEGNQFGIDTETLQEWGYASRFIDTEVSTMTAGMKKLTTAYAKGNKAKKKSVTLTKGVTVSLKKENGEIKTQSEFYLNVIDQLHGMTNVAQRNAAAQKIFGKSYTDMIPLIESGTGALRQYSAEARSMGIIISSENVGALGKFDDQMQRFDATIAAIKTNIAVALLPFLEQAAGKIVEFLGKVSSALSDGFQPEDIKTIVNSFFEMFKVENGDTETQDASLGAFLSSVLGTLKEAVSEHKDEIKNIAVTVIGTFWDAFKEVIGIGEDSTAAKVWNGIKTVIKSALGLQTQDVNLEEEVNDYGMTAAEWWANGFTDEFPVLEDAGEDAFGEVEKGIGPSAHSKSTHYGQEMANGLAAGIEAGIPRVSQASQRLAAAAAAPIHFSKPDIGPLRYIDRWGGEMIDHYIGGIKANAWKVSSAIGGAIGMSTVNPIGRTTNLGGVSINVYGAAGQDVNQLADIVMMKMQNAVSRREAVFA